MTVGAADRWAEELAAWAIPERLLATAEESPYGWSQKLWKRRSAVAAGEEPPLTVAIVANLMPVEGTLLDVGAGRGRASLPVAEHGHRLIGVDESPEMLAGLVEDAAERGLVVEVHAGRWPDIADDVPGADVAMAANVAYNVADIGPFVRAMLDHAHVAVVLEVTERHPWAHLGPLYRAVHGLDRPAGPTVDDLAAAVTETVGIEPVVHRWKRPGQVRYESWDELTHVIGRRLVVPRGERASLRRLLEPDVVEEDGLLRYGTHDTSMATLVLPAARS